MKLDKGLAGKLGQQAQALLEARGLSPGWDELRQLLLRAGAAWLWRQQGEHAQPTPALLRETRIASLALAERVGSLNQPLEPDPELNQAFEALFAGRELWAQLQLLASLAEQAAPPAIRRQAGIYYTPPEVSDFVVDEALQHWQPRAAATFLDPACGSGLFLWGVLARVADTSEDPGLVAAWIEAAHGCDTDALALAVADFGFRLYWQRRFPFLAGPNPQLRQLDALHSAGDSLGLLQAMPSLAAGPGLIISNPPYVGERSHKALFSPLKQGYWAPHYRGRGDLYYYFFHLALALAKADTVCALLTPNYFRTATAASHLRERLRDQTSLLELVDFGELSLFPSALGHHSQLTIFRPGAPGLVRVRRALQKGAVRRQDLDALSREAPEHFDQTGLFRGPEALLSWQSDALLERELSLMQASGSVLGDHFVVRQGIVSGADRLSPRLRERYGLAAAAGSGIFVLDAAEYQGLLSPETAPWLKPWFKNSDIRPGQANESPRSWLIYAHRGCDEPPAAILKHLARFRPVLEARREVQLGRIPWWQLQWPREPAMFTGPKLLLPQRAKRGIAAYTEQAWYASADVYYILPRPGSPWTLLELLPLLNSERYTRWWSHRGKRKGGLIELYYQPLMQTPLPAHEHR